MIGLWLGVDDLNFDGQQYDRKKDEQSSFSYHFTNLVTATALPAYTNII